MDNEQKAQDQLVLESQFGDESVSFDGSNTAGLSGARVRSSVRDDDVDLDPAHAAGVCSPCW
jgi:hypothetical protein